MNLLSAGPVTNRQFYARFEVDQHAVNERLAEVLRPYMMAMNDACTTVLALGYRPEQCAVTVERSDDWISEKRTLEVLGKPCFEVTLTAKPFGPPDWELEIEIAPRGIEWPPAVTP